MHMADALVTPAVAGTAEPEADGDAYETAAAVYQKFWRSGKHSGPYTCCLLYTSDAADEL